MGRVSQPYRRGDVTPPTSTAWSELERLAQAAERYGRGVAKVAMALVPVCAVALLAVLGSLGSGGYGPREGPGTRLVTELAGVAIGLCLLVAGGMASAAAWNGTRRLRLARAIEDTEAGYAGEDAEPRRARLREAREKAAGDAWSYGLGVVFVGVCLAWIGSWIAR